MSKQSILSKDLFLQVVDAVPLVSIDLVVVRNHREVLLGLRNNRPAQNFWFVPGGRILKDEPIADARARILEKELGLGVALSKGEIKPVWQGAYEHMYDDCFAGDVGTSTHYVVLAHRVDVPTDFALPIGDEQHAELKWWPIDDVLSSSEVHQYTKNYFLNKEVK